VSPRKAFLLRVTPELYQALERWAAEELRSVNGQIEYLLTQAVRRSGRVRAGEAAPPDDAGERGGSDESGGAPDVAPDATGIP
jgi:hypothetical protein